MLQRGGWWDEGQTGTQTVDPPAGLYNRLASKAGEPGFSGSGQSDGTFYLIPFSHNTLLEGQNSHLPWLQGAPDPLTTITWQTWVEMNDGQAKDLGLREGDIVRLEFFPGGFTLRPRYLPPRLCLPASSAYPWAKAAMPVPSTPRDEAIGKVPNVMNIVEPKQVEGTGALAWATTRVRVLPTGDSIKVSKLEGQVRAVEVGITTAERIIQTVGRDER